MHSRKFVDMPEDDVDKNLMEMKSASPKGVFYNICWCNGDCPYHVSLRFITGKNPDAHTIVITPTGFVWGPTTYHSLEPLLMDFEKTSQVWARVGTSHDRVQGLEPLLMEFEGWNLS